MFDCGDLRLDPERRLVELRGQPVSLSSRSFDILHVLIAKRDQVVSRDELISLVWAGATVEASNLTVQMSALRKALGDTSDPPRFIATISGRGYRFIGPAERAVDKLADSAEVAMGESRQPAPTRRRISMGHALAFVAAGCIFLGAVTRLRWSGDQPASPRLSIVILPFRSLGEDQSKAYLADAITEDLQTDLAQLPGSLIIDQGSAREVRDRSLAQIGQALKVRYVIEGSFQSFRDQVHVDVHLIDPATGTHLWDHGYDGTSAQPRDTTRSVVRGIASALAVRLPEYESSQALRDRPDDPDAVDLFFQARALMDRQDTLAAVTEAQSLLANAITKQPDLVEASALLGLLLVRKMQVFDDPSEDADHTLATQVIRTARAHSPKNTVAQVAYGRLLAFEGHCDQAVAAFHAALETDGSSADALTGLANCASVSGHPDAVIPALERAIAVDPASPVTKRRHFLLGLSYLFMGRHVEAIDYLGKAVAEDDSAPSQDCFNPTELGHLLLVAAYVLAGDKDKALRGYAEYNSRWPNRTVWRVHEYLSRSQSNEEGVGKALAALKEVGMHEFADEHADLGVEPPAGFLQGNAFSPTPKRIPGGHPVDTDGVVSLLSSGAAPLILDVGRGAAVIKDAHWVPDEDTDLIPGQFETTQAGKLLAGDFTRKIVVLGSGTYGIEGYNFAHHLISIGYRDVLWYRGGEEAWASARLEAGNHRDP